MNTNPGYVLRKICGIPYLLPVGQNIALHKKSLILNETGVILWNAILQGSKKDSLSQIVASHYSIDPFDPSINTDIDLFLKKMTDMGLIYPDIIPDADSRYFSIGNLNIKYYGPDELLHNSLLDFESKPSEPHQSWEIILTPPPVMPLGEKLIHTSEIEILRTPDSYILHNNPRNCLTQTRISLDGTRAQFFCHPSYDSTLKETLFHAFRFAYLLMAANHGYFAIHSASLLYKEKAWLFTGPSGTGKSTHVRLWEEAFSSSPINGDLNLIGFSNDIPMVYGIPWCGTSNQYDTCSYQLGGITLLKQHSKNVLHDQKENEKVTTIMNRLISPSWTESMLDKNLDFAIRLAGKTPVYHLLCTKEPAAAHLIKESIDNLNI